MSNEISSNDDYIDSRDVIARIDELQTELDDLQAAFDEAKESESPAAIEATEDALATWTGENHDELKALLALNEGAEGYAPDWRHGATLVRDSYFKDHAMELADDIGAIDANQTWPLNCIDWEQAARELQMDYTSVDFDGVTYWVR